MIEVSRVPFRDHPSKAALIVQRYGTMDVGDAVEKALRRKLPKTR